VLDAALVGARLRLRGPVEIAAALAAVFPGPGRLIEWDEAVHPPGVALWLERVGDDGGAVRQRHYLHLSQMTLGMMGVNLFGTCTMKSAFRLPTTTMEGAFMRSGLRLCTAAPELV